MLRGGNALPCTGVLRLLPFALAACGGETCGDWYGDGAADDKRETLLLAGNFEASPFGFERSATGTFVEAEPRVRFSTPLLAVRGRLEGVDTGISSHTFTSRLLEALAASIVRFFVTLETRSDIIGWISILP